ncbi:MAG: AMP-dependent synthetase/ligase [Kineosporiaceae bacterium]
MTLTEFSSPSAVDHEPRTLPQILLDNAAQAPDAVVLGRREGEGWRDVTSVDFLREVTEVARGLVASGVGPGDRVALMAKTRYEWTLLDFAIWHCGAVTVPVYETSSAEQVAWILSDSRAVACVVETPAHAATVASVRDRLPDLREVWTFDEGAVEHLVQAGAGVDEEALAAARAGQDADSVATIIYTSGTTGRPKGCELTHANFTLLADNVVAVLGSVVSAPGAASLLFLPLAHVFARFIQVLCLSARARLGHAPDVTHLTDDLASFRPTFVLAVPRVFEKIYNATEARAAASGKSSIFRAASQTAIEYSRSLDDGGPGLLLRLRHAVFDRLVYARLRAALGGRVEWAVSGGAPLGERLAHFFRGAGITVLEGWGLTETTAPVSVNRPELVRVGSVGLPLPGVSVRVDADGELLVSGINVMRGYHGDPEAAGSVLVDGWLRTGDLGEIDDDGYVRITGRKKELIVTAGGKNVSPMQLEDVIRAHPLISQCMVVGDQRPYVAAMITLDPEMLGTWLSTHGLPPMDVPAAAADPTVRAELQRAVDAANATVSRAEAIKRFTVLDFDLTEADGYLTAKQSLRRQVIMKDLASTVDDLYA